ncbi:MAG: tyrosine-type recombinase/integrase [Betaproteobacteria bacterium]|nr:tyrosine-type recombinase/integrase [Betaproteobacteria bacterium]
MAKLNEQKLQALLKENKPVVVAVGDGSGLSLRITATGAAWQLRYRHAGKPHWLTISKYSDCSLKEAQKKATKERARINEGIDPVADRRRSKLALKAAKTFRELAADYDARALPDLTPDTQRIIRQFLKRDILPRIGDLRIEEVGGGHIVQMAEQVGKRSDSAGRRAFEITSVIFSHGVAKQVAKSNPCAGLKLRAILGKKKSIRPGVTLSEDQLRTVLANLSGIGARNALAVKIILATCVRKVELRLSRPEHLDLDRGAWTIPEENAKNGKPIVIPLAPVVVDWFKELLTLAGNSAWVIPGQSPKQAISQNTLNEAIKRLKNSPRFTPHDLRRTARTHLGKLGVDIITAEKCLNHTLGGLVDVYDRGDYFEERRKALALWADFLVRCEQPADKVISLRKAG